MEQHQKQKYFENSLFIDLKDQYDARLAELQNTFATTLDRIENSPLLHSMKTTPELHSFRIEHIIQIINEALSSSSEKLLEQQKRTIAMLKAQLSTLKMELNLHKTMLQKYNNNSKNELEMSRSSKSTDNSPGTVTTSLQSMVEKQIANRIQIIEKQYILKADYDAKIAQLNRQIVSLKIQLRNKSQGAAVIKRSPDKTVNEVPNYTQKYQIPNPRVIEETAPKVVYLERSNPEPEAQQPEGSTTRFEEIQASFAKQLEDLRKRMAAKRELISSPDSKSYMFRT